MSTSDSITAAASGETDPGTLSQAAVTDDMINDALNKLDADNDDDWTTIGKPAMEAVNAHLPTPITRARLDEVAPDFSRPEPASEDGDAGDEGNPTGTGAVDGDEEPQSFILAPLKVEGQPSPTGDPLDPPEVSGLPAPGSLREEGEERWEDMVERRLTMLEADNAFLRKTFGWPTKDA